MRLRLTKQETNELRALARAYGRTLRQEVSCLKREAKGENINDVVRAALVRYRLVIEAQWRIEDWIDEIRGV